jgi:hypothetical protein
MHHIMIILIRNPKVEISFDNRYSPTPTYSKTIAQIVNVATLE